MSDRATFHQILAILTVGLNELSAGIINGWMLPIVELISGFDARLIDNYHHHLWVVSLSIIGKIIGTMMAATVLDKVGRKPLLSVCAITFCLPWLVIRYADYVHIFYVTSAVFGIACGINEVSNSAYLGENCSPSNRGVLGTISTSAHFLGVLTGFISTIYFDNRTVATISFFITLLSFISVFWMVEPVQYLLMKGKYDQAKKNFAWLKNVNNPDQLAAEFENIRQNVYAEESKKSSYGKIFTSPANYKSLLIMLTIYSLVGMTGYQLISPFNEFHYSDFDPTNFRDYIILLAGAQFLFAALSSFIIGRFNRKSVILISFSLISLSQALIAILLFLERLIVVFDYSWYICYLIIVVFAASAFAFSYPTLFILRSELFPLSIKGIGSSIVINVHSVTVLLLEFIISLVGFDDFCRFMLYSVFSAVLVLFVHYKVPETRNKSLIEIQEILEGESE